MGVPEYKIFWIRKSIPMEATKALLCRKLKQSFADLFVGNRSAWRSE